jgi:hypothetical protein
LRLVCFRLLALPRHRRFRQARRSECRQNVSSHFYGACVVAHCVAFPTNPNANQSTVRPLCANDASSSRATSPRLRPLVGSYKGRQI